MTNSWIADVYYSPGDPLFRLRKIARNQRLTAQQKWLLRRKWLKNWTMFVLFGPLY